MSDESPVIPLEELRVDDKLHFVEEPVEVMDREIKKLKRSLIPIIKVDCELYRGPSLPGNQSRSIQAEVPTSLHQDRTVVKCRVLSLEDKAHLTGEDYITSNTPRISYSAATHFGGVTVLGGNTPRSDEERIEQDDLTDFVPPTPHDSPLSGGHTPGSDEGKPNINELMDTCTTVKQVLPGNINELLRLKWINDFVPIDFEVVKDSRKGNLKAVEKKTYCRKRTSEKVDDESVKRQKIEDDAEKEALRAYLDIISGDDEAVNVESLATNQYKSYKIFTEMLNDFDRQDVLDLYRLVKKRFKTASPEGYDRLLWGDLITVFEPSEDDDTWKAQQDYTLISWRLFDSCGVHVLLMDTGIAIHMLIEKIYPFIQEMLSRMLSRRLEVDHECEWKMPKSLLGLQDHNLRSRRVVGYILLVIKMHVMKKLND
ncbi:hypothetical protein Tco_0272939 [Tanacetum coccineum]